MTVFEQEQSERKTLALEAIAEELAKQNELLTKLAETIEKGLNVD